MVRFFIVLLAAITLGAATAEAGCHAIRDADSRHFCTALTSKRISACTSIRNKDSRIFCQALVGDDRSDCPMIRDSATRAKCKTYTRDKVVRGQMFNLNCINIRDDDDRQYCKAMEGKNPASATTSTTTTAATSAARCSTRTPSCVAASRATTAGSVATRSSTDHFAARSVSAEGSIGGTSVGPARRPTSTSGWVRNQVNSRKLAA